MIVSAIGTSGDFALRCSESPDQKLAQKYGLLATPGRSADGEKVNAQRDHHSIAK
jgi:hypothetical protein